MKALVTLVWVCAAAGLCFGEAAPTVQAPAPAAAAPAPAAPAPAPPAAPAPAPPAAATAEPAPHAEWTFAACQEAFKASNRNLKINETDFKNAQARKAKVVAAVEKYLTGKFKEADPNVVRAFCEVPREYFHYNYEQKAATINNAYESDAKPWGIGYGSVMSDYLGQVYMTQLAKPQPNQVVLEIGTGSGFQAALLSRMVKEVYSIEIIEPVGKGVQPIFAPIHYDNVHTKVGDGYYGWPEVQGGFDTIMVTCAARFVPPALLEQLKPGGNLIIPVGSPIRGAQTLFVYSKDADGKIHSRRDVGVYFIPMTGAVQKAKKPEAPAKAADKAEVKDQAPKQPAAAATPAPAPAPPAQAPAPAAK
ncbi:MAG: protein-L-isoaspartate O-methyltransferase [Candidatus Hydrogenedentes bacterium]|nr:protein-L-isoaspartate O-methyltransferase [Candidatus Hydrogenedentota bacterium]